MTAGHRVNNIFHRRQPEPMPRRLSAFSAALICSVCLVVLFVSHRLVNNAAFDRTPFLDIGRTIQGWSMNELENDGSPESSTIAEEISVAVNEQRQIIFQEMMDYFYPNGRYNNKASTLSDLTPESGGRPVRSLILTTWRSGSTFLGDVLNSHPGNFYHYEPLLNYSIVQVRHEPAASKAVRHLTALLKCDFHSLSEYLEYGKEHIWLFTHNTRLWEQCQRRPALCWIPEFLSPFCKLFPFQSMKTVRIRLKLIEPLLQDPDLNVRVVLLVRDPRGTLQSRKHRDWCPGRPDCSDPQRLCADLVDDYDAAIRFKNLYPDKFRAVRYEDLSVEPIEGARDLFTFYGLDFHPSVRQFLDTHTKIDLGGVSSTFRNSKSTPFHWRQDLTHSEVRSIEYVCREAMEKWGYLAAHNATYQREFNPLGDFTLDYRWEPTPTPT